MAKRKPPRDLRTPLRDYKVGYSNDVSLHHGLRNCIQLYFKGHNGGDYKTTINDLHFFAHNRTKDEVRTEIAKWTDLSSANDDTPITLPAKFFE